MEKLKLIIYSILHFLVDLSCVTLVYRITDNLLELALYLIIIYNFSAFAMQLPLGILIDKIKKNNKVAVIGSGLVVVAPFLTINPFLGVIIAGIGNSLFHLGAGVEILEQSNNKAAQIGIFVSTGALGVFGAKYIDSIELLYIIVMILALIGILPLYLFKDKNNEYKTIKLNNKFFSIALLLGLAVFIRSFIGFLISYDWQSNFYLALLMVIGVFLGKFFGGIIGDKFGLKKTTVISLGISSVCLILGEYHFIFGVIGIFLFNMVMPITLILLSNTFQNNKGFAFGITTFALFLGFFIEILVVAFLNKFVINCLIIFSILISIISIVKSIKYIEEN